MRLAFRISTKHHIVSTTEATTTVPQRAMCIHVYVQKVWTVQTDLSAVPFNISKHFIYLIGFIKTPMKAKQAGLKCFPGLSFNVKNRGHVWVTDFTKQSEN